MLGILITDMEQKELKYLLKREMEELLHDLDDYRIDHLVKRAMEERYQILFKMFRRFSCENECYKYMPRRRKPE